MLLKGGRVVEKARRRDWKSRLRRANHRGQKVPSSLLDSKMHKVLANREDSSATRDYGGLQERRRQGRAGLCDFVAVMKSLQ